MKDESCSKITAKIVIPLLVVAALFPFVSGAMALVAGICVGLFLENPYQVHTKKAVPLLLGICITGLGAGMNLAVIAKAGMEGVGYTFVSITMVMAVGLALGIVFSVTRESSLLISAGTAICGGSAIAAVSAALRTKAENTSVALAVVFALNALALIIFPPIGHWAHLSETQFGLWSALAIHDTSSVVGATMKYGSHALEVGSTVKLTRALWIAPLVIALQFFQDSKDKNAKRKIYFPWFIWTFLLAATLVSYFPFLQSAGLSLAKIAKQLFVVTLFFIGSHISKASFKAVGWRPLLQGISLWLLTAVVSLLFVIFVKSNIH